MTGAELLEHMKQSDKEEVFHVARAIEKLIDENKQLAKLMKRAEKSLKELIAENKQLNKQIERDAESVKQLFTINEKLMAQNEAKIRVSKNGGSIYFEVEAWYSLVDERIHETSLGRHTAISLRSNPGRFKKLAAMLKANGVPCP